MLRPFPVVLVAVFAVSVQAQPCPANAVATRAPFLAQIAGDDAPSREALAAYVCAYRPEALGTTADLVRTLTLRDSVLARLDPRVEEWFFADEEQHYEQMEAFYAETEALALRPVQAEGMVFGLTVGPLMDGLATVLAPPDLIFYLDFMEAEGDGAGSEYPFGWLDPEIRMVLAGETLRREFPASPYVGATQEAFAEALLTLASLHPVLDTDAGMVQWMAGVGTSEFYPWASDDEALGAFVEQAREARSRYHAPFAALLAGPSEAVYGAELALVVIGDTWASREDAQARALAHLDAGQDVAGPMLLGTDDWVVVYRYYPAGDARVEAARSRAEEAGLVPRVLTYTPEVY